MKIALIIGRKGSKRIVDKNKKIFCGKPIIFWPINTLKKSGIFDKIYLSTDDKILAKLGKKYNVNVPFLRNKKLSGNNISTIKVVKNFIKQITKLEHVRIESLCCVYASAPFFTTNDLKSAFNNLKKLNRDFSFLATPVSNNFLRSFSVNKKKINIINKKFVNFRGQDLPNCYIDAGQFYWANKDTWLKKKTIFTDNSVALIKNENSFIDINEKKDWIKAEKVFKKKNNF
jgi:pseudaminic acid cytidylyltransferase